MTYYLHIELIEDDITVKSISINNIFRYLQDIKGIINWQISTFPVNLLDEEYDSLEFLEGLGKGGAKGKNLQVRTENET